jgi:hypothetical protein
MNQQALLALRDLVLEAMDLPPEQEASADASDTLRAGLEIMFSQGAQAMTNIKSRQPPPRVRPAVLALQAPTAPHFTIFRTLPAGVKPGAPVLPLPLNANGKTYLLHVGHTFIPASDFDGNVPDELASAYTSGSIVVTPPGMAAKSSESLPLLWSRARSIAFGLERMGHADAAAAKPQVAAELVRIAKKTPKGSGEMHESIAKLAIMFNPPKAGKFEKPEGFLSAKNRQHAKRAKAIAAGEDPHESELIAAHMPSAQQEPVDYATNSFGKLGVP